MSPFRPRPLAPQIALVVCSVLAIALALKVEVHWRIDQAEREQAQRVHARRTADRLAAAVDAGVLDPATARALSAPTPGGGSDIETIDLVDRRGAVTWSTRPERIGHAIEPPPMPAHDAVESGWVTCVRDHGTWAGTIEGDQLLVAAAAIEPVRGSTARAPVLGPPAPGAGMACAVYVTWDIAGEAARRDLRHARYHLSGLLFALLLGLALWWLLRRVITRPIEELARTAGRPDLLASDLAPFVEREDEIGALARAVGCARSHLDDARREAAERAARLSGAIDATADGIVLATLRDGLWIVDHANARFAALSGRPAAALEGRTVEEGLASFTARVVDPDTVTAWIASVLADPEFEGSRPGALRVPPDDEGAGETLVLLDVTTRPVRDDTGRAFGRLWVVRDVTLERTHENRLKRQNQELAALDLVGRRVARSLDRRAILASALATLREVTDAPFGVVLVPGDPGAAPLLSALADRVPALSAGEVVAWPDVTERAALVHALPPGVSSLVALPLSDASGLVAVLALGRGRVDSFDTEEVALLRRVVHSIDAALENARLFTRTEEQLVENQTLTEVSRSIGRTDGLEAVLEEILRVIHVRLHYRNAAILLPDENDRMLYVRASVGYHTNLGSIRLPVDGPSVTARALTRGEPVNVDDVRSEPGYVAGSDDIRSELALPLKVGDRVLGVLDIESDRLAAFSRDDERLLASVANQAAMVLQNARLLVETRARATRFEAVNEIARTVSSTLDPVRLDQAIVSQIARVVPCERYAMLHYDHEARRIRCAVVFDPKAGPVAAGDGATWAFEEGLDPAGLLSHRAESFPDVAGAAAADRARAEVRHVARGTGSMVVVPIALDGVVAAAIVAAADRVDGFTGEQIRLLETVSYHVGVALKNAQLFARLQQSYTQLDEAQDGLVRSEKLRALGEMASGVAHDFNNVLGAILGRAQLLKQDLGEGPAAAELDIIEKAAQDGAATVRRLQDFTRVRTDRGFQAVSLPQIVRDCLSLTRGRWRDEAERSGVHYEVTEDLAAVPDVAGEPSELREVLTNLILNALDAMPGGGTLHLSTRAGDLPGEVHLLIGDDGAGMSDEVRVRIFDPFFTTKGVRGVGLGLSVVYGIVQRHGGRIEVTSAAGQGTTMRVVLPVAAPALLAAAQAAKAGTNGGAAHAAPPVRPAPSGSALRVLVIDDEPGVRTLLADLLRAAGHDVVAVASGREGLAVLEESGAAAGAFDLVLSDLGMPDMSGWDVARAVRARAGAPPVVLVTGWGIQLDDQLLEASGVCDVIAKPFTIEEVLAVAARATIRRAA